MSQRPDSSSNNSRTITGRLSLTSIRINDINHDGDSVALNSRSQHEYNFPTQSNNSLRARHTHPAAESDEDPHQEMKQDSELRYVGGDFTQ